MVEEEKISGKRCPIAKEAIGLFLPLFIAGILSLVVGLLIPGIRAVLWWIGGFLLVFALFILYFFRDPEIEIAYSPGTVLAPAYGKVVGIADVVENEYIFGKARRVSIFLRIYDVHMNYAPVDGKVEYVKYRKGRFGIAGFDKASELNEHVMLGVSGGGGKIAFKMIAGMFARRIVTLVGEGAEIRAGEKIGLIKFGSRADVFVPPEYEITVKVGQKVKGALTVIARRK